MLHNQKKNNTLLATQSNLLAIEKLYPETTNNHYNISIDLSGELNLSSLREALRALAKRHEMLRANLAKTDEIFEILPITDLPFSDQWPLTFYDMSQFESDFTSSDLYTVLSKHRLEKILDQPFKLYEEPLWRIALIQTAPNEFKLIFVFNHLIVDAASINIILNDLSNFYNDAYYKNNKSSLKEIIDLTTLDFSLSKEEIDQRINYWKKHLENFSPLSLKTDFPPEKMFNFAGKRIPFSINQQLIEAITAQPLLQNFTFNQIFLACVYTQLFHLTNENNICIGITSANRKHQNKNTEDLNQVVNSFFNSLPLSIEMDWQQSYLDLLSTIKSVIKNNLENQLPHEQIYQEALTQANRYALSQASIFNVMVVVNRKKSTLTFPNVTASQPVEIDINRCKFPYFAINCTETDNGYDCFFEYNVELFKPETIRRFIDRTLLILEQVSHYPNQQLKDSLILLDNEKNLIKNFNDTINENTFTGPLHTFYSQQAKKFPENIAVMFHHEYRLESITYQQLDELSDNVARNLIQANIKQGQCVGVSVTRSINLIVAMLGAMKAGAVLVPLETEIDNALRYKVNHANLVTIITDDVTQQAFIESDLKLLQLFNIVTLAKNNIDEIILPQSNPEDIVYIMYTSGTTADPKGVAIRHRGLTNLLNGLTHKLDKLQLLKETLNVLQTSASTFDAILFDWKVAWITGGSLHLQPESLRFVPSYIEKMIMEGNINTCVILADALKQLSPSLPLKYVISMGAPPTQATMKTWMEGHSDRVLENGYGLTETSICLSLEPFLLNQPPTYIGRPISNMQMFILNSHLTICPIGFPGQIYVAGPGLGEYFNDPKLTATKFITVYFNEKAQRFSLKQIESPDKPLLLYATGDTACYEVKHNGELTINSLGRRDIVKICGVNLDLKVIENLLLNDKEISDVIKEIALLPNNSRTSIIAFVAPRITNNNNQIDIHSLFKNRLSSTSLPIVAYPRSIFLIDVLPKSKNGKTDYKLLEKQINTRQAKEKSIELSPLQETIRNCWAKTLNISNVDIELKDSFKSLGGHSLLLGKLENELNNRLKDQLNSPIKVVNFLKDDPTLPILAERIRPFLTAKKKVPITSKNSRTVRYFKPGTAAAEKQQPQNSYPQWNKGVKKQ